MNKYKSYTHKAYCFREFAQNYEQILARQCENKRKDECIKLVHIMINTYHLDYTPDSYAKNILASCNGNECYEIAEFFGLSQQISQPFLQKACKESVDDACYALGK